MMKRVTVLLIMQWRTLHRWRK